MALTDPDASDASVAGSKAANLARAAAAGLPVLPGFVITTGDSAALPDLDDVWRRATTSGARPVIVRSSSTVEDAHASSMAGQFESVLGARDRDAFDAAVAAVLRSAARPAGDEAPMAVVIQEELSPSVSGVLFGVEPVTGDRRHLVTDVVAGSPQPLVSGAVSGDRYVLSHTGRVVSTTDRSRSLLTRPRRRALARLARSAERVFGGPQDIEWAFGPDDRLWLFQARPVTVAGRHGRARRPLLGPGPVSETFPRPLRRLEADLWADPLRAGIIDALRTVGAASEHRLAASPVVAVIGGWVAVDLDLLGVAPTNHRLLRALDPRGPAHRLIAAWRVGKLRAALPELADEAIHRVDAHLRAVPPLRTLSDIQLAGLLRNGAVELTALHSHEVVAGMLMVSDDAAVTAASVALAAIAAGRADGWGDDELMAREPVVLALTAPRVGTPERLPPDVPAAVVTAGARVEDLPPREALRLRVRWVQELTARAATELGRRLVRADRIADAELVAQLSLDEVAIAVTSGEVPRDLATRRLPESAPLPPTFRLTKNGEVVAVVNRGHRGGGRAAGGGRGIGPVRHWDTTPPEPGDVLVVERLAPDLAAVLPGLHGLVSETGSALSHLAILAREFGVPTVVGVADARRRFPPGGQVIVDGDTGEVTLGPSGPSERETVGPGASAPSQSDAQGTEGVS